MDDYLEIQRKLNQFEITTSDAITSIMSNTADILKNSEELSRTTNIWLKESISIRRLDTLDFLILMSSMTGLNIEQYLNALKEQTYLLDNEDIDKLNDIIDYIKQKNISYNNISDIIDNNYYNDTDNDFKIEDLELEAEKEQEEQDFNVNILNDINTPITLNELVEDEDIKNSITDIKLVKEDDTPDKIRIAFGEKILTFVKSDIDTDSDVPLMIATPYNLETQESYTINSNKEDINSEEEKEEDINIQGINSEEEENYQEDINIQDFNLEDISLNEQESYQDYTDFDTQDINSEEEVEDINIQDFNLEDISLNEQESVTDLDTQDSNFEEEKENYQEDINSQDNSEDFNLENIDFEKQESITNSEDTQDINLGEEEGNYQEGVINNNTSMHKINLKKGDTDFEDTQDEFNEEYNLEVTNIEFNNINDITTEDIKEDISELEDFTIKEVKLEYNNEQYLKELVSDLDDDLGIIYNSIPQLNKPTTKSVNYKTYRMGEGDLDV